MNRNVRWLCCPTEVNDKLGVISVCDSVYYSYAKSLIKSVEIFSPGTVFFLHLVNPSLAILEDVKLLLKCMKGVSLFISYEEVDLSRFSDECKKSYYACVRFIRISELLKSFNIDFFCVDADSLIVNPIDNDFTNKPEADICLVRRDIRGEIRKHLAVATGSIYIRNTAPSQLFFDELSAELRLKFAKADMPWFTDQIIFFEKMSQYKEVVAIRNIKKKYADWSFDTNSILWAGKGDLKNFNLYFLILQNLLGDSELIRNKSLEAIYSLSGKSSLLASPFSKILAQASLGFRRRAVIYLPRIDMPWKLFDSETAPPVINESTVKLRLEWKRFCIYLANALERGGFFVEILEIPAWEITPHNIYNSSADLVFVPHRCYKDFDLIKNDIPVYFYMQEFFPWLFVVDNKGWSAASSIYPINFDKIPASTETTYELYLNKLYQGQLDSKFYQPEAQQISALVDSQQIPQSDDFNTPYKNFIFFPLQIPHDQSIKYFSDFQEVEVISKLLDWSLLNDIPIVFKPHPANIKSMAPLLELIKQNGGYIADANIHDLIELSSAVYTINSGVGFEALLHGGKPIVTFGRVEYDCCTFKSNLTNLNEAWSYCLLSNKMDLQKKYSRFFNWFVDKCSYDMSNNDLLVMRLRHLVKQIKARHFH